MKTRTLGKNGPSVSALGLGLMGMSDFYGAADEAESIAVIHAALDAGVTLFDTGDFYGTGHNEMLLGRALDGSSSRRDQAFIQVKFGVQRDPSGGFIGFDGRPTAVKNALAHTLKRLRTDYVDLYMPARIDPAVPIEDTIGAIGEMVDAGYVRHIGLSEAGPESLARAHEVRPIRALQREYSLISRDVEGELLTALRERGTGLTAYGVLSRGLLSGRIRSTPHDYRSHLPRFQGDNLAKNLALVDALVEVAHARGVTASQMAIAWVLHRGDDIVPVIGARKRDRLAEALGALDIALSNEEMARLEAAVAATGVAGERYDARGMQLIAD
ncbi:aldo/keto reductase [Haliangium sp.]|uniref:aldo/keto reductase n=1 Tax=Haliangium sp. TaxID=2663208 RepID=UPI003D11BE41